MARFLKQEWLQLLILAIPFILLAVTWNQLPDVVPTHWGLSGHPNGYTAKGFGLFVLPIVNIGIAALLLWIGKIDPKAYKMKLPNAAMKPIRLALTAFVSVLVCVGIVSALGANFNSGTLIDIVAGIFFILLGNFLPTVKPNYFVGIRTPWSLENPENWRLTHVFGGRLWVVASVVYLILIFLIPSFAHEAVFLSYLAIIILPPYIYSYVLFQRSKRAANDRFSV